MYMQWPLKTIDKYLNKITMYRLVVYGLMVLLAGAIVLGVRHTLPLSAAAIVASLAVLLVTCFVANYCFAVLWEATSNTESWLITALILCLILPPATSIRGLALIALGGLIAMASKYIVVYRHKHLFKPAAFEPLVLGLTTLLPAIWWVGSRSMLPLTAVFGLLLLRKLRRFQLFFNFLIASLGVAIIVGTMHDQTLSYILTTAFRSGPLVFLGTVMLTEPETTPPGLKQQYAYGLFVGAIFTSQLRLGTITATPRTGPYLRQCLHLYSEPKV